MNIFKNKIMAANWKMNFSPHDTKIYLEKMNLMLDSISSEIDIHIYVPYIDIPIAVEYSKNISKLKIGAQNCHFEDRGAFTGEISVNMLLSTGVKNVLIGHSERRKYFLESDDIIDKKISKALREGMFVILCVGETMKDRESNMEYDVIYKQLSVGLRNISIEHIHNICIAYEPVWAIGTGKSADESEINKMCKYIRKVVEDLYTINVSEKIYVIYGGSLDRKNIGTILSQTDVDGGLIGSKSLDVYEFCSMINVVNDIVKRRKTE